MNASYCARNLHPERMVGDGEVSSELDHVRSTSPITHPQTW